MQGAASKGYTWSVWTQIIFGLVLLRAAARFVTFSTNLDAGYEELALVAGDVGLLLLMLGDALPAVVAWMGAALVPWSVLLVSTALSQPWKESAPVQDMAQAPTLVIMGVAVMLLMAMISIVLRHEQTGEMAA